MSRPVQILKSAVSRYWGIAALVLAWQAWVSLTGMNAIVVPRPLNVLADLFGDPMGYLPDLAQTVVLATLGLIAGMALGTALAVATWFSRMLSGMLVPLALILSSVPVVSLIPVLARILGYDVKTVFAIVVIITFFPAFVFTSAGLRALPPGADQLFTVLGASRWKRFLHLVLPAAVPSWMIALRLAAPGAILAALVAEFLMGMNGLGYLLKKSTEEFAMERAFGVAVLATVISVTSFSLAVKAEQVIRKRWN